MGGASGAAGGSGGGAGAFVCLTLMVLVGSSTATAAKLATRELPIGLLPPVRFGIAGLGLLLLPSVRGRLARIWRDDRGRLLAAAACCVPINQTFFLNGNFLAPTSHTGMIYASCPLVVLLLATALGQERLRPERLAGVAASVLGMAVIAAGNLGRPGPAGADAMRGDLLLVGAVISWGAYLTVNKPLVERHGSLPALAATFLLGALLDLPVAAWTLPAWPSRLAAASPGAWASLAYLTLVSSLAVLALQNLALHRLDASQVATVNNLSPVLTIVWGIWLLGESMTPTLALGGALVLGGALWSARPASTAAGPRPRPSPIGRAAPAGPAAKAAPVAPPLAGP
jgi:drug/metabolite transporter (DMT)-like permease